MRSSYQLKTVIFIIAIILLGSSLFMNNAMAQESRMTEAELYEFQEINKEVLNEQSEGEIYSNIYGEDKFMNEPLKVSGNKFLWNQDYYNETSVKKNIYAKTYIENSAGTVRVYIKNTGNNSIKVNIYKSAWNSKTIDSATISAGSGRTFVIGSEYGESDCTTNNCYHYHDFTISVYTQEGTMSFYGQAYLRY